MSQTKYLLYIAGEWLLGVTNLQSHPELCDAGDNSSFRYSRSKEETCSAVESFVGESLPDTPLTYMSLWYTTPHQFLLEMLITVLVVLPIIVFGVMEMRSLLSKMNLEAGKPRFGHNAYYKTIGRPAPDAISQHWAYLAQPCHVLTLFFACSYSKFINLRWGIIMRHIFVVLAWGPFLALAVPDLPNGNHLIALFFIQHVLLMLAVPTCLASAPPWMLNKFWFNWTPFFLLVAWHFWCMAPLAIVSGANVGTMTHPPLAITFAGRWYRPAAVGVCVIIHFTWTRLCQIVQALNGDWGFAVFHGMLKHFDGGSEAATHSNGNSNSSN